MDTLSSVTARRRLGLRMGLLGGGNTGESFAEGHTGSSTGGNMRGKNGRNNNAGSGGGRGGLGRSLGDTSGTTSTPAKGGGIGGIEDCSTGRCPSHDTCPVDSFCCLDRSHKGCRPRRSFGNDDVTEDGGWRLVLRQQLPTAKYPFRGGYFKMGELSKNKGNPSAPLYSILDELERFRGSARGDFEFKVAYPGNENVKDIMFVQSTNPVASGAGGTATAAVQLVHTPTGTYKYSYTHTYIHTTYIHTIHSYTSYAYIHMHTYTIPP